MESRNELKTKRAGFLPRLLAGGLAALLGAGLPAGSVLADPPIPQLIATYSGLWTENAPATRLYLADDLAALESRMTSESAIGYRLAAFESWLDGATRRYAGLFRSNVSNSVLVTGLDEAAFETERLAQIGAGRRLIDLEVELAGGSRVYAGLFATGIGGETAVYGLGAAAFEAEIAAQGPVYRLLAFDTWWEGGEQKISAVFRSLAASTVAVAVGLGLDDFLAETVDQYWEGRQLIDLEITEVPAGNDLYSGRFKQMTPQRNWLGLQYANPDWLTGTDVLLGAGHDFSAVGLLPDSILPSPTVPGKDLLDLEINLDLWLGIPNHLDPLHDCGTPGPPRPPTCG